MYVCRKGRGHRCTYVGKGGAKYFLPPPLAEYSLCRVSKSANCCVRQELAKEWGLWPVVKFSVALLL